jgi:hypothetical protein
VVEAVARALAAAEPDGCFDHDRDDLGDEEDRDYYRTRARAAIPVVLAGLPAPAGPAVSAPRTVAWEYVLPDGSRCWFSSLNTTEETVRSAAEREGATVEPLVTLADADAAVTAAVQDAERRIARVEALLQTRGRDRNPDVDWFIPATDLRAALEAER